MKKLFPILILCALLLVGCAKKEAAPEGSGSAEPVVEQTASGAKDKSASKPGKTKPTAAPAQESSAAVSPQSGESAKPSSKPNPTVPDPTPTPKIEDWDDAEAAQQQIMDLISVNPVGNWIDSATGAMMVIDGEFHGSILITQKDGSSSVWAFTGEYDPTSGVLSYSDGLKQTVGSGGMKTAYQNSSGSVVVRDGKLVWSDAHESKSITFTRDET